MDGLFISVKSGGGERIMGGWGNHSFTLFLLRIESLFQPIMTEDIDALQKECLKDDVNPRTLFLLGNILERKSSYMNEAQLSVQKMIQERFSSLRKTILM